MRQTLLRLLPSLRPYRTMASLAKGPTVVVAPGNFSQVRFWDKTAALLTSQGHKVNVVGLESCRETPVHPVPGMAEDVQALQRNLRQHVEEGEDVVLLMHSYGGMTGTEACKGLSRAEREREGRPGGIIRLVFLAAVFAPPGRGFAGLFEANVGRSPTRKGDWLQCDFETSMCFYSDQDPKGAGKPLAEAASLLFQAPGVFRDTQTNGEFHKYLPSSYIVTKKDIMVPEPIQRDFIRKLEEQGNGRAVDVYELDTAHSPHQTDPEGLSAVLFNILEACR